MAQHARRSGFAIRELLDGCNARGPVPDDYIAGYDKQLPDGRGVLVPGKAPFPAGSRSGTLG
ncbi:MAG: hypothetical protein ACRD88_02845, partial [Terriglobia bacterium]